MGNNSAVESIIQELRRGLIVLAVLAHLRQEQYGYSILKELADLGLEVDQGTLYPLLRRLEAQGLLVSTWRLEEARPRRYYAISEAGRQALPVLKDEWARMSKTMERVMREE